MLYLEKIPEKKKKGERRGRKMKRVFCLVMLLVMTISGSLGTTAWAVTEDTGTTAFEKQVAKKLTRHQFMKAAQVESTKMTMFHGFGKVASLQLEAPPYINGDGILMVAAEDVGAFLGWEKTRMEYDWDENGNQVTIPVENQVKWEEETGKIKIEVPWSAVDNFYAAQSSSYAPYMVPYEDGEKIESWEGPFIGIDGKKYKIGKAFIEMKVGSNIWSYRGYRYIARTNCEQKDGRVYLPIKDIHQTMLPNSRYHWDAESKILATIEEYRE